MHFFNLSEWKQKITDPHWYRDIPAVIKELSILHDTDHDAYERAKEQIYAFFEEQLRLGKVALGKIGKNFDAKRQPIDTVVIHHTSLLPGLTKERLSAIELVRLYAPQFAGKGPTYDANKEIKSKPIYSGHFRDGVQIFWPYHWIVRTDGTCERLLSDNEIGWQAGKWEVNCRSVAIVFDNDYENSIPSDRELEVAAKIIREHYPEVPKSSIIGHCEVNTKTTCPSKFFLSQSHGYGHTDMHQKGWKEKLANLL